MLKSHFVAEILIGSCVKDVVQYLFGENAAKIRCNCRITLFRRINDTSSNIKTTVIKLIKDS
jgi:hypothetical protein